MSACTYETNCMRYEQSRNNRIQDDHRSDLHFFVHNDCDLNDLISR